MRIGNRGKWKQLAGGLVLAALGSLLASGPASADSHEAAIVIEMSGKSTVAIPPELTQRPLELFHSLPAGSQVRVAEGDHVHVVFLDGRRYELGGPGDFGIGASGITSGPSKPRPLKPVGDLTKIAAAKSRDCSSAWTADQSRDHYADVGAIHNLYPCEPCQARAKNLQIRFSAVPGVQDYQVTLEDEQGSIAFETEAKSNVVPVSPFNVQPATRYRLKVVPLNFGKTPLFGECHFSTLPPAAVAQREELRQSVLRSVDASSLALLAEMDRRHGLLVDAQDTLSEAVRLAPDNPHFKAALSDLIERMTGTKPK